FEVCRRFSVTSHDSPTIFELSDVSSSHVNHRFDSDNHSFNEKFSSTFFTVVWHFWIFVHLTTQTVTYQFSHNTVISRFAIFLNSSTNIIYTKPNMELVNPYIK